MTETIPQDVDIDTLARIFDAHPDIEAVYLFGSAAEGRAHSESDIDLGVLPRTGSIRDHKLDLMADLVRHGFSNADVVFLDTDDIVLQYEVVRLNCLIYSTPDFDRGQMYSRVVRQYLDFLPYLNVQRAAYKRSILRGTPRGHSETSQ